MSSAIQYGFPASLPWSEKLVSKLSEPGYRHAYMVQGVKNWIARQVRTLREERGLSQEDLGQITHKPQSAISRVEDPDYGKLTLQTLFDLAKAYDVPLLVQFVEWSDWLSRTNDSSAFALQKNSFSASALRDLGAGQESFDLALTFGDKLEATSGIVRGLAFHGAAASGYYALADWGNTGTTLNTGTSNLVSGQIIAHADPFLNDDDDEGQYELLGFRHTRRQFGERWSEE